MFPDPKPPPQQPRSLLPAPVRTAAGSAEAQQGFLERSCPLLPNRGSSRPRTARLRKNLVKEIIRLMSSVKKKKKKNRGKYSKNLLTSSFRSYYRWKHIYTSDNRCSERSSVVQLPSFLLMQLAFCISPRSTSILQGYRLVRMRM